MPEQRATGVAAAAPGEVGKR